MAKFSIPVGSRADRILRWSLTLGGLVVLVAIPFSTSPYRVSQFTMVAVLATVMMGLNLLTGFNGQISLGHSFFVAIGAYTAAILMVDHSWPYLLTLFPAFAITFVMGFLFGIPALRLEGLYLALVTLALAVVAPPFIKRFGDLTGGSQGIVVGKPEAPGWSGLADDQWRYLIIVAVAVLLITLARNLVRGRVGKALIAIRDNHIAAEVMGVDPRVFKTLTFALSAAYAGVAGALYTWTIGFVSPESFLVSHSVLYLAGAVVGGLATVIGPLFGGLFNQFVPEMAADIHRSAPNVLYGAALILVIILMPQGVVGLITKLRDKLIDRSPRPPAGPSGAADSRPDGSRLDDPPIPDPAPESVSQTTEPTRGTT
ncbi:MAG: branched-chain amino acid ABC transporter permease [Acidimicrobiales bacterium]